MARQSVSKVTRDNLYGAEEARNGESFLEFCRRFAADPGAVPDLAEADNIMSTLQGDIIPRLMLVHSDTARLKGETAIRDEDRLELRNRLLTGTSDEIEALVARVQSRGASWESILVDLLAEAARSLGEEWSEDSLSFAEVSVALCRMHGILRRFPAQNDDTPTRFDRNVRRPSILLATAPGDQHIFGVMMIAEFFRKDGFTVETDPCATKQSLKSRLSKKSFDLLGISASWEGVLDTLPATLTSLRKASANPSLQVMIGGPALSLNPEAVADCNADALISDANQAASVARCLLAMTRTG